MKTGIVDPCPDLETIAVYLDGRLAERERNRMAEHLAACETCYTIFTEAAHVRPMEIASADAERSKTERSKDERSTERSKAERSTNVRSFPWTAWSRRHVAWSGASVGALAASLVLLVWTGAIPWRESRGPELKTLVTAMSTERTIEPRLSGFTYAPLHDTLRAGDAAPRRVPPDVRIVAYNLEKQAFAHRTAPTLKALGVAYLLMEDIDRAVPLLEEAAEQLPDDAGLLSDLAAGYLVRAARRNQPQDLTRALALADRAVKADPALPEAWFNRALALQRLALGQEARDGWREYLAIDHDSGWAEEARRHLSTLP